MQYIKEYYMYLKNFLDKAIMFIIDRKTAIDIIENLPKTQKERQEAHHMDTLTQIIDN
jgi:pyrroloquinoline quinone (PQQ) biosynthesis protein C